jgi:hypothetical protein
VVNDTEIKIEIEKGNFSLHARKEYGCEIPEVNLLAL